MSFVPPWFYTLKRKITLGAAFKCRLFSYLFIYPTFLIDRFSRQGTRGMATIAPAADCTV